MLSKDSRQTLLLLILISTSLYLNFSLVDLVKQIKHARRLRLQVEKVRPEDSYCMLHATVQMREQRLMMSIAYIAEDHPLRLPIERKLIKMVAEESVRYSITDPEAEMEWLWTGPVGDHSIRLGSEQRGFTIAMFHQLHCLRITREALMFNNWTAFPHGAREHLNHCFTYIRMWTLCDADTTLEPGDFTKRNFTLERTGGTHTCYDWEAVYDRVNEGWDQWEEYRIAHGVPPQTLG